jgi:hypothetical protein
MQTADMTDRIKLYIHIGSGKTGTSAIQAFLNNNRTILFSDHSCLYPNTDATGKGYRKGQCRNHLDFFKNKSESEITEKIRDIIAFSRKNKVKKIVFSWEGLFERQKLAQPIKAAVAESDDIDPYVILYLRRQDHWLESAWKQWFAAKEKYTDFNHFIDTYAIGWKDSLAFWSDIFGQNNIIIQPYESAQLKEGLISNFLKKTGIEYGDSYWVGVEKQDYNPGLHEDIIEILYLNRDFYPDGNSSALENFLSRSLPDAYKKKPFERYSLLSPQKRIEILNRYEPVNRSIAHNFLQRADGRLFYEPWPSEDEPYEGSEGMTVEKLVPILSYILYSLDAKREKPILSLISKKVKNHADYFLWRLTGNTIFHSLKKKSD